MRFDPFGYDKIKATTVQVPGISQETRDSLQFGQPLPVDMYSGKGYLAKGITLSSRIEDENTPFEVVLQRFQDTAKTLKAVNEAPENLPLPVAQGLYSNYRTVQERMHRLLNSRPLQQSMSDEQFQELLSRIAPMPQEPQDRASLSNMPKERQAAAIGRAIGAMLSGDQDWAQHILEPVAQEQAERDKRAQFDQAKLAADSQRAQMEYQFIANKLSVSNQAAMDEWQAELGATEFEMKSLLQAQEVFEKADDKKRQIMRDIWAQGSPDMRLAALAAARQNGDIDDATYEILKPAVGGFTVQEQDAKSRIEYQKFLQGHRSDTLALQREQFEARKAQAREELDFKKFEAVRDQNNIVTGFMFKGKELSIQEALANSSIKRTLSEIDLNEWSKEKLGLTEGNDILKTLYDGALDEAKLYESELKSLRDARERLLPNQTEERKQIDEQIEFAEEQYEATKRMLENARKALDKARSESQGNTRPILPGGVVPQGAPIWEQSMRGPIGQPPTKK